MRNARRVVAMALIVAVLAAIVVAVRPSGAGHADSSSNGPRRLRRCRSSSRMRDRGLADALRRRAVRQDQAGDVPDGAWRQARHVPGRHRHGHRPGPAAADDEQGLLGLAFHPALPRATGASTCTTRRRTASLAIGDSSSPSTGATSWARRTRQREDGLVMRSASRDPEPQRRRPRLRAGRTALHRRRRRWRAGRPRRQRPGPVDPSRQAPAHRPARPRWRRARAVSGSRRQSVRRQARARRRSGPTACASRGASRSTGANGDLWIGDVGEDDREEVTGRARSARTTGAGRGRNYGWSGARARSSSSRTPVSHARSVGRRSTIRA